MADKDATPAERVAAEMAKKSVRASLYKYAFWRTRSEADADDLLGEAILCASDPDRKPWDPAKKPFFKHMRYLLDDLAIERARTGYKRFEELGSDIVFEEVLVDPRPRADDLLDSYRSFDRVLRWGSHLESIVRKTDPIATKILEACTLGIETLAEQAAHAGCTEKEAFEGHRRLRYHAARVVEEQAEAEARRMKEAALRAKKMRGD